METSAWPLGLKRFAAIIGARSTLDLVGHAGGLSNLYIPKAPTLDHPWAQVIGWEALVKLSQSDLAGTRVYLPRGCFLNLKKRSIADLYLQGWGPRAIALELGCSERYVQMIVKGYRALEGERWSLFERGRRLRS